MEGQTGGERDEWDRWRERQKEPEQILEAETGRDVSARVSRTVTPVIFTDPKLIWEREGEREGERSALVLGLACVKVKPFPAQLNGTVRSYGYCITLMPHCEKIFFKRKVFRFFHVFMCEICLIHNSTSKEIVINAPIRLLLWLVYINYWCTTIIFQFCHMIMSMFFKHRDWSFAILTQALS